MSSIPDLAVAPSPFGVGEVLLTPVGLTSDLARVAVMCIAPAGVRVFESEPIEDAGCWRMATWTKVDELWSEPSDMTQELTWAELVSLLPETHHDWMRRQAEGQLKAILAFGLSADQHDSQPEYRSFSKDAGERLISELCEAFPADEWSLEAAQASDLDGVAVPAPA